MTRLLDGIRVDDHHGGFRGRRHQGGAAERGHLPRARRRLSPEPVQCATSTSSPPTRPSTRATGEEASKPGFDSIALWARTGPSRCCAPLALPRRRSTDCCRPG